MAFLLLCILAQGETEAITHLDALKRLQHIRWIAGMDGNDSRFQNAELQDLLGFRTGHLREQISRIWREAGLRIDLIPAKRVANNWVEMPWGALMDDCTKQLDMPTGTKNEGALQDQIWAAAYRDTQRPSADPQVGSANLGTLLAARAARAGVQSGKGPGKASSRAAGGGSAAGKAEAVPAKAMPVRRNVPAPAPPAPAMGPKAPPAAADPFTPPPHKAAPWPATKASYVPQLPDAEVRLRAELARGAAEGIPAQAVPKDAAHAASAPPSASLSAMNVDQGGAKEPDVEPTAKEEADAVLSDTPPSPEAASAGFTGTLEAWDDGVEMDWTWGPAEGPGSPYEDDNPEQNHNPEETPELGIPAQARLSLTASLPSHRASACVINE